MEEHQDVKLGENVIFRAYQNVNISTTAPPTPDVIVKTPLHGIDINLSSISTIPLPLFCAIVAVVGCWRQLFDQFSPFKEVENSA